MPERNPRKPQPAKAALIMAGTTQAEFARRAGYSRRWVNQVLNGLVPAPARFQHQLAAVLGQPVEALFREVTR